MKYSKLIYLCAKNVIYYDDSDTTYSAFLLGNVHNHPDYSMFFNNLFTPLNTAISRLNDLEKIPYQIERVVAVNSAFSILELSKKVKEIIGIAKMKHGKLIPIPYTKIGNEIIVQTDGEVFIEFKEDIPYLTEEDYSYNSISGLPQEEQDFDMKDRFNIDETMCAYIIEYVKGVLTESVDVKMSDIHLARAESYFTNISRTHSTLKQINVKPNTTIEEL